MAAANKTPSKQQSKRLSFFLSRRQRQIKTNTARRRQWRNANVTSAIVRRVQSIVRKPVSLFGRLIAPLPAVADFFDFFARDRTTVLVVAAFIRIPRVPLSYADTDKHRAGNHLGSHWRL